VRYARELAAEGVDVSAAATVREAAAGAAIVITATSAAEPLLRAGWLDRGTHVTAVGADMPHKQELDPRILAAADKYVPDSIQAAAASGELHHAIAADLLGPASVYGELGALASGQLPGRTGEDELTVADLTGLGVQDAAVAALVTRLAEDQDAGRYLPLGEC
jgi:ornithine cyclodeaminase